MTTVIHVNGILEDEYGVVCPIKTKFGSPAASGVNAFIAAVSGRRIRVLAYRVQAAGTVAVTFVDTTTGPQSLSAPWSLQAREGAVATAFPGGYEFQTDVGVGVQVSLNAAVACNVMVQYIEASGESR